MEEERSWRLERSESNGNGDKESDGGDGLTGDHQGDESNPTFSATTDESPSSPPGPAIKFNGVPIAKPTPPPMAAPQPPVAAPMPSAPVPYEETMISTSVTEITVQSGFDPGWNISDVLCILYDCGCQCQRTLACIVHSHEAAMRADQIRMLRDCADVCHMAWCFLQRNSRYSLKLLKLCAQVCEACAAVCSSYLDIDSQRTTATCLRCAAACRAFIEAHS